MMWPFRHRHKPEEAPTVKEAMKVRDSLFGELEAAIKKVDRVQAELRRLEQAPWKR